MEKQQQNLKQDHQLHPKPVSPDNPTKVLAICSLLVFLSGTAVIVCWSILFHPSNRQLWMVPFGLVLIGTPITVWCSVLASDSSRLVELMPRRFGPDRRLVVPVVAVVQPDLEK
ncbi:hypothetical protein FCM35_KLT11232 [Carex littledalei]|uniref:Uncharacterized protein n=1 Tax=Carex littledalei TaxID=544730 RepID=A0A833QE18_9POAL|nr:hypothetical protein FCM35_KLT11232 [Carex littledalei]